MLKYILCAFVLLISKPSFCASNSFANPLLSMSYAKNNSPNKNGFLINKKALIFNKIKNKKRFPIFGIGSIIAFALAVLTIAINWIAEKDWGTTLFLVLLLASLILGIVGLVVGEFMLWSILGISLTIFFIYALNSNPRRC